MGCSSYHEVALVDNNSNSSNNNINNNNNNSSNNNNNNNTSSSNVNTTTTTTTTNNNNNNNNKQPQQPLYDDPRAAWADGMPSEEDDVAVLDAMVAAGCRDGCSKLNEATVDGLPFGESLKINRALQAIFLDEEGRAHGASLSLPSEK